MEKCNNRIITLSGDPASGKGSISNELKRLYEEQGMKVHIVSIGSLFRKVLTREYKKMFPHINEPSIEEMNSNPDFAQKLKEIDQNLDNEVTKLGEEINSEPRPGDIFIIDSRLAWYTIPNTFAVRLTVDAETAGRRVFNDKKRGKEDKYSAVEEAIQDTASRRKEEIERYKKQYGADLTDLNNFKLVINTTLASIQDIAKTIKICEELELNGKEYAKTWASPELFYPTQDVRDTLACELGTAGYTLNELTESIKKHGIYPDAPVLSKGIRNDIYHFVVNGHHRIFSSIMAGQTIIPYIDCKEAVKSAVPNQRALSIIYDHEDIPRPDGTSFRYAKYPEIDKQIDGHDMLR